MSDRLSSDLRTYSCPHLACYDMRVQAALDDELSAAATRLQAKGAVGLITNVQTGEVLAMSSWPTFDPNHAGGSTPDQLRNRAVASVYEMGSTYKVFPLAVGLDTQASLAQGRRIQAGGKAIEGALDNLLLRVGGPDMDRRIDTLIEAWSPGPYIFNLGHGVLPDTPVAHIERAVRRITGK